MDMKQAVFRAVLVTSFIGPFSGSAMNLAVPAIGLEFSAGAADLSRIVSAYLFGAVMLMLPMGRLADIIGRKRLYKYGVLLFIVTTVFVSLAISVEMLYIGRFLQGCVLTMIFSTGMAMLLSVFDKERRGRVIGYSAAATYAGLSTGPVLGGFICHYMSWRAIFFGTALVLLISLWLISKVKEDWYGAAKARFDFRGSLFYMIGSPLLLYGLSNMDSEFGWLQALLGAAVIMVFLTIEWHSDSPLIDLKLFKRNYVFIFSNLAAMIHYSATFAIGFLMSLYLQLIGLLSAPQAGMILLLQPFMMALLSPKAGALSDRITPGKVASLGMAIDCLGLFWLSQLSGAEPLWQIGLVLAVIGIGFALFSSPNNNAVMGAVEPKVYGTASSVLAAMRLFGQAISMAIVTFIMEIKSVDEPGGIMTEHLLDASTLAFAVFAGLCMIGVAASLARSR